MIKVAAPTMACEVIDWAIQAFGGGGVCQDFGLAYAYAGARTLRLADGPDEVHRDRDRPARARRVPQAGLRRAGWARPDTLASWPAASSIAALPPPP